MVKLGDSVDVVLVTDDALCGEMARNHAGLRTLTVNEINRSLRSLPSSTHPNAQWTASYIRSCRPHHDIISHITHDMTTSMSSNWLNQCCHT
jgi:hypothetical protein